MTKETNFKWDDKAVVELAEYISTHTKGIVASVTGDYTQLINDFKQSKGKELHKGSERIEVDEVNFLKDVVNGGGQYYFTTSKQFHADKFPLIKEAIENVLNDIPNPKWGKEAYTRLWKLHQGLYADYAALIEKTISNAELDNTNTQDEHRWSINSPEYKNMREKERRITELENHVKYLETEFEINKDKVFTQSEVDTIREEAFDAGRNMFQITSHGSIEFKYPKYKDYLQSLPETFKRQSTPMEEKDVICPPQTLSNKPEPVNKEQDTDTKDWEVLTIYQPGFPEKPLHKKNGKYVCDIHGVYPGTEEYLLKNFIITSVKRLSDNEVFTIGDKVIYDCTEDYPYIKPHDVEIKGFKITDGDMQINIGRFYSILNSDNQVFSLKYAKKKSPEILTNTVTDNSGVAILSLNDVLEVWSEKRGDDAIKNTPLYKKFEQKVKEKLKQ